MNSSTKAKRRANQSQMFNTPQAVFNAFISLGFHNANYDGGILARRHRGKTTEDE